MGYKYGIKEAIEILLFLSSSEEFEKRLSRSFSEIDIKAEDVSEDMFQRIKEWKKSYVKTCKKKGDAIQKEKILKSLGDELVWICVDIIEENTRTDGE